MKKKTILLTVLLLSLQAAVALADNTKGISQILTVEETQVQKTVSEIRFDGNNAILLFTDKTTQEVDMQHVRLSILYDQETGLNSLRLEDGENVQIYDLTGRKVEKGQLRSGGVYIVNGKKYLNKN